MDLGALLAAASFFFGRITGLAKPTDRFMTYDLAFCFHFVVATCRGHLHSSVPV